MTMEGCYNTLDFVLINFVSLYCAHLHQVLKVSLMGKLAVNFIQKIINFVILKAACFPIDNNFC